MTEECELKRCEGKWQVKGKGHMKEGNERSLSGNREGRRGRHDCRGEGRRKRGDGGGSVGEEEEGRVELVR